MSFTSTYCHIFFPDFFCFPRCFRSMPGSALTATKEKKLSGRQWFESGRAAAAAVICLSLALMWLLMTRKEWLISLYPGKGKYIAMTAIHNYYVLHLGREVHCRWQMSPRRMMKKTLTLTMTTSKVLLVKFTTVFQFMPQYLCSLIFFFRFIFRG